MDTRREQDPYPLTWEVPAAVVVVGGLGTVELMHLGRALANLTAGGAWAWPTAEQLFTSIPRLLTGDAAAGLATTARVAPTWLLLTWITVVLVAGLVLATFAARWSASHFGPGAIRGTASVSQARAVLGTRRLRRHRHVIRPDLAKPRRNNP